MSNDKIMAIAAHYLNLNNGDKAILLVDAVLMIKNLEAKLAIAVNALEKIGCNETFHSLGGRSDCDVCLALFKINYVKNDD